MTEHGFYGIGMTIYITTSRGKLVEKATVDLVSMLTDEFFPRLYSCR